MSNFLDRLDAEVGLKPILLPPVHAVRMGAVSPPPNADPVYAQRVAEFMDSVRIALVWFQPSEAAWVLQYRNKRNRPMRATWRLIKEKIGNGLWHLNGETAIFDRAGQVMSAQHRLKAIASGDKPVPVLCVFGIDPEAFATLDQGIRRNGRDVLALLGKQNAETFNSALNWCMRYANKGVDYGAWIPIPNEKVSEAADRFPALEQSVLYAAGKARARPRLMPLGLMAFIHYALSENDPFATPEFLTKVIDGIGVREKTWEHVVRSRLLKGIPAGDDGRSSYIQIAALMFKAFNYTRSNRQVVVPVRGGQEVAPTIVWKSGEENFPELNAPGPVAEANI